MGLLTASSHMDTQRNTEFALNTDHALGLN